MANMDWPHGFISVGSLSGGPPYLRTYLKAVGYGTAIGFYDLVDIVAAGTDIEQGVAGGPFAGISLANSAASTAATHLVEMLTPALVVEGQTDLSLVTADTGLNADVVVAARDANTGISNMEINSATEATTSTLDLRLLRLAPYVGNASGTNSRWFCLVNDNRISDLKAGA